MKLYKLLYIFFALTSLMCSCTKNEVKLSFRLDGVPQETLKLDYYASDKKKGWVIEEFVNVQQGNAQTILRTVNPALIFIAPTSGNSPLVFFYAERGDEISISGKGSDPLFYKISGNRVTDDLTAWRLASTKALAEAAADPAKGAPTLNKLVADYVKANPEKPASMLLLLCYYNRRADEQGFEKTRKLLKGDALDPTWSSLVARADMIDDTTIPGKLPGSILLKTIAGCDTIRTGKAPAILYFYRDNAPSRGDDLKALRKLSEDYKDSASRIICDISFEPDSSSRVFKMRNDSLRKTVRAWMPLGPSDSIAKVLAVRRTPLLIVADTKGNIRYRGDDIKRATSTFRSLLKP